MPDIPTEGQGHMYLRTSTFLSRISYYLDNFLFIVVAICFEEEIKR